MVNNVSVRREQSPRWKSPETPAYISSQISITRQLSMIKNSSDKSGIHLKASANSETKYLKITTQTQKEEQLHFDCIIPSLTNVPSAKRTLQLERFYLLSPARKGGWVGVTSFPSLLRHCMKDLF